MLGRSQGTHNVAREAEIIASRLPLLRAATGPPIMVQGSIGGFITMWEDDDPRLKSVSMGFPASVHPLCSPNTRAQLSTGSSHSIIDFRFTRLCGLVHEMTPLRPGIDRVTLQGMLGPPMEVFGWVDVAFDILGYEFKHKCWVVDLHLPVEIQLGMD
ncbi:hypothetical protein QCA50_016616 [Cerrena zonata]|uniref:Uncharacterized protein n=1 Tax=Cerrena zonata TaxID=2478898 RepID=A0AAW0FIF9_9APHY